jgi:OPA family glycerol-3-phosphate transporter-like MFS transporter 1/2
MYGWRYVHYIPSLLCTVLGCLVLLLFKQPKELNAEVPGKEAHYSKESEKTYTIRELWKIPMVAEVAITVFCLKVVRYCMYMWLPM